MSAVPYLRGPNKKTGGVEIINKIKAAGGIKIINGTTIIDEAIIIERTRKIIINSLIFS